VQLSSATFHAFRLFDFISRLLDLENHLSRVARAIAQRASANLATQLTSGVRGGLKICFCAPDTFSFCQRCVTRMSQRSMLMEQERERQKIHAAEIFERGEDVRKYLNDYL